MLLFNLSVQLVDINFHIAFLHYGMVQPSKPIICLFWWFIDYEFYFGSTITLTWMAIERHILIFHHRWVLNRRGCFLLHYLPIMIIPTYILLFYIIVIFFLPCQNTYDYTKPMCNPIPCYESYGILSMWEYVVHAISAISIEAFASISFLVRVQLQRRRLQRSVQWNRHRRVILQLLLISALNVSLKLPTYLIPLLHLCGLPPEYGVQAQLYFFFLGYFVIFFFPFSCLCQHPELFKHMKNKVFHMELQAQIQTAGALPALTATGPMGTGG